MNVLCVQKQCNKISKVRNKKSLSLASCVSKGRSVVPSNTSSVATNGLTYNWSTSVDTDKHFAAASYGQHNEECRGDQSQDTKELMDHHHPFYSRGTSYVFGYHHDIEPQLGLTYPIESHVNHNQSYNGTVASNGHDRRRKEDGHANDDDDFSFLSSLPSTSTNITTATIPSSNYSMVWFSFKCGFMHEIIRESCSY